MQSRSKIALIVLFLILWLPVFSQASEGTVRFKISIDPALLPDHRNSGDVGERELVSCEGAFVSLAPPVITGRLKPAELREWYQSISQPGQTTDFVVTLKDGQFAPRLLTIRTGDSIVQGDIQGTLRFEMFTNATFGILGVKGTKYTFHRPEQFPVEFFNDDRKHVGFLLITDHPFAAVSDKEGAVQFSQMPTNLKIPMRVAYPLIARERYKVTSPHTTISSDGKFFIKLPQSGESIYEIHLIKRPLSRIDGKENEFDFENETPGTPR